MNIYVDVGLLGAVMPCGLTATYERLVGTYCFHIQGVTTKKSTSSSL